VNQISYTQACRIVTKDGVTVNVLIVRLENETEWSLEVVNSSGSSIVWDDPFPSDKDALAVQPYRSGGRDKNILGRRKGNPFQAVRTISVRSRQASFPLPINAAAWPLSRASLSARLVSACAALG
jgi:hypothetical protein